MKLLVKENKGYLILVGTLMLALMFSGWRTVYYQFMGNRSASLVDFLFVFALALLYHRSIQKYGYIYPLRQLSKLWYLWLPLALMFSLYTNEAAPANLASSITRYALVALSFYMLGTALVLSKAPKERLLIYLLGLALAVISFYILVYVFTRFIYWKPFIYGTGTPLTGWTPALNYPFGSPTHAGLFLLLNLILGVGVALTLRKYYLLYFMVPVSVLEIFQTGSRSVALFLVMGMMGFFVLILLRGWLLKMPVIKELTYLLLSGLVAAILLFFSMDMEGERALSIFGYNPMQLVSGEADEYRANAWRMVSATESGAAGRAAFGMHNAYFDLWLSWGKLAAVSFVIFLLVMVGVATMLLWSNRHEEYFFFMASFPVGLGAVIGAIYANPLMHLKFIWIYFGLILSLHLAVRKDS